MMPLQVEEMGVVVGRLTKKYGHNLALKNVSLSLPKAKITGLLGQNGAGKSTLLNILATLLKPSTGTASINGYDILKSPSAVRRVIGFLPQQFGLYDNLTIFEFLDYLGALKRIKTPKEQIQVVLEQVGLLDARNRRIGSLSGGMRQRVGVAQALLGDPLFLMFDEPFSGLDPTERNRFRQLLVRLASSRTILLSTHLVEDIALTAHEVIILHQGEVRFTGKLEAMVQAMQHAVWEVTISSDELESFSQQFTITHTVQQGSRYQLRFISETPPLNVANDLKAVSPTLEDAYLGLVSRR